MAMASSSGAVAHHVQDGRKGFVQRGAFVLLQLHQRGAHVVRIRPPRPSTRGRHRAPWHPSARLCSSAFCMPSNAMRSISGPTSVPCGARVAHPGTLPYTLMSWGTSWSYTLSCTNRRRSVVQRWPAVPMAAKAMPRSARSRSAEGRHDGGVVATQFQKWRARNGLPGAAPRRGPWRWSRWPTARARGRHLNQHLANVALANDQLQQACGRVAAKRARARWAMACVAMGGERVFSDGFHTTGITTHQRQRGVPRPHGHREVEGRDDAAHAQRVPGFHHAVAGRSVAIVRPYELARQAHGKVADVDHLLHLAQAFGRDLARLRWSPAGPGRPLAARSSSPSRRISSPPARCGHRRARWRRLRVARPMASLACAGVCWGTWATTSPVRGERKPKSPPW